jgi:hypothetical protein
MKRSLLLRFLIFAVACMITVAIRSETESCKASCYRVNNNKPAKYYSVSAGDKRAEDEYLKAPFFIKI